MFNLNENNRLLMSMNVTDLRKGASRLCSEVRRDGFEPSDITI